ncbi:endonuclease domain-containing protein [Flavisolibacter ginsenosidimutans]|uniref:Endonuclease domain-containing protein n=2 Tax=Flavisolibacter ginsenosidimutans TaxID=661481 RepID=A0A5B8UPX4_9BACT|nr:endonuclease domain-containing protein [Flavisolibacter ginsenosidimutans]
MFAGADKLLFQQAAELRNQATHAEDVLWGYLRTKPYGFKFRRQHPYVNYILDFYCHALELVIEVDGSIHQKEEAKMNDAQRQQHLESDGLHLIRFTNDDVEHRLDSVINTIENHLQLNTMPDAKRLQTPKSPL